MESKEHVGMGAPKDEIASEEKDLFQEIVRIKEGLAEAAVARDALRVADLRLRLADVESRHRKLLQKAATAREYKFKE